MKRVAHYVRKIAYFLLAWFLLVWAQVELNILGLQYDTFTVVIDLIIAFLVDVVLSIDASRILTQKFEMRTRIR